MFFTIALLGSGIVTTIVLRSLENRLEVLQEEVDELKSKTIELAMCEKTKLYGNKSEMVKKTRIVYRHISIYSPFKTEVEEDIYFSPEFAPEWDIEDIGTGKYYKVTKSEKVQWKPKK